MIHDLYKKLKNLNISIRETDGRLDIRAAKGVLSDELLTEIRDHKQDLIDLINSHKNRKTAYDPIPMAGIQPDYPLSSAQRRLWLSSQIAEGNIAYNTSGIYILEGDLDHKAFEHAIKKLIDRHEILRTVFREVEPGLVRQFIYPPEEAKPEIAYFDLRDENGPQKNENSRQQNENSRQQIKNLTEAAFVKPFDLTTGPLLRNCVYRIAENERIFSYTVHHIICDGLSMDVLIRELFLIYNAGIREEDYILEPLRIQYKDYAVWQQEQLRGNTLQADKEYWLDRLGGELPVLDLPGDNPRPSVRTYKGGQVRLTINKEITRAIRSFSRDQECTLFMSLVAAVNALLHRYTGQTDIIVGSQIAGREHADLEEQIGLYLNTLVLRARFSGEDNYRELLMNIKDVTLEAYKHQAYPFDELVEALDLRRDVSRGVLFDISVVLQNTETGVPEDRDLGSLRVRAYEGRETLSSKFDLAFDFTDLGEEIKMGLLYNSDIYSRRMATQLATHLARLLEKAMADPESSIDGLELLDGNERDQQLTGFNNSDADYPNDKTVADLFAEQAARTPDKIAVVFAGNTLTYKELDGQSNRLAHYLRKEHAIQPNDLIGIMLDRSEKTIIAILGILKSGGAYVPIDPEYPRSRKSFMVRDTGIKMLITQTDYIFDLDYYGGVVFAIDVQLDALDAGTNLPVSINKPQDLAYVMYTSGSTGMPKGVMIPHAGVVRLVKSTNFVTLKGEETLLSTGAVSFDATTFEYWSMLLNGGRLVMCSREILLDAGRLGEEINREKVDTMWFTAGWLNQLVDADIDIFKGLKTIVAGGDKLSPPHINALRIQYPDLQIVNGYGPTENTTFSLTFRIDSAADQIPLGKPVNNSRAYIMSQKGRLLPVGVVGEIWVGGAGLARGYLNNPELTMERFVPDPFRTGERLYRTGDLGKWLPDGNIAFIGRKDDQVKIRGYRVELGEIESRLKGLEHIKDATVVARQNETGDRELVAYVVGAGELNISSLGNSLAEYLPDYMLPSYYVQMEILPLTGNGKLDKKALPDPETPGRTGGMEYVPPANETEANMAGIWEEILGRKKVGVRDSFFELGGDSIKILRMISEVRKRMGIRIPVAFVYQYSSIESLVVYTLRHEREIRERNDELKEAGIIAGKEIEEIKNRILSSASLPGKENVEDIYPMSAIEKGMLFASLLNNGSSIYHDQFFYQRTFFDFDIERFRLAMTLMADKHAILRTSFNMSDYETEVQIVHTRIAFPVDYINISEACRAEQEKVIKAYMTRGLEDAFRVSIAPLWRMSVFNLGDSRFGFAWQFHHAILDGWSNASFITELNNLYLKLGEEPLYRPAKLRSGYKDFVIQQSIDQRNGAYKSFWRNELAGFTRLDLFREDEAFGKYSCDLDGDFLKKIEKAAIEWNSSVKVISLSAWLYMLKVLHYGDEVVTGLVTNTRPDCEDGDKMLGCFLNTIPLRIAIDENEKCADLISRVNNKLITLKEYERLSLPEIALINDEKQGLGNPFFDVLFNYVDFHVYKDLEKNFATNGEGGKDTEAHLSAGWERTNTWLDLSVNVTDGNYRLGIIATKKLKCGLSSAKLGDLYCKILSFLVNSPHRVLHESALIGAEEERQLLVEFNDTAVEYSGNGTIVGLFKDRVAAIPGHTAIIYGSERLSYLELDEASERVAYYLRGLGVKTGTLVPVCFERSIDMIVGMLGILKAGGAYVPIDPDYPQERIHYMMQDCAASIAIVGSAYRELFLAEGRTVIVLKDAEMSEWQGTGSSANLQPHDLAYVIYTSGSTGRPKGVMIEHTSVVNLVEWHIGRYEVGPWCRSTVMAGVGFDACALEIWSALLSGSTLYVVNKEVRLQSRLLLEFYRENGITHAFVPPALIPGLVYSEQPAGMSLKYVLIGGDRLGKMDVRRLSYTLVNQYGPTESTVMVTDYAVSGEEDGPPPIGRPLANTWLRILGPGGNLLPVGIAGELYIGGVQLARGYLNREDLTREKFVPDPYKKDCRLYRTGDLCRWLPDGNLEYIGRVDDQVKIRGHRIELKEVEHALQDHPDINTAVATVGTNKMGENELLVYMVGKKAFNTVDIRAYLKKMLPSYMLPDHFIQMEALPLTPNGKVDKKQLPDPQDQGMETGEAYLPPRDLIEEQLISIWQEVLGKEKIGIKDDFFDLGGHSLKVTRLSGRIQKEFEVAIPLKSLFERTTPEEQAQLIKDTRKTSFAGIPSLPVQQHYPLSSSQRRLWVLSQFEDGNVAYNMPGAYMFEGDLDREALNYAFNRLIGRHEILRTIFKEDEKGDIRQLVQPAAEVEFRVACHRSGVEDIRKDLLLPFNLSSGPLLRAALYETGENKWIFIFIIHHIVSDGWSADILVRELLTLYNAHKHGEADPLPALRIQYRDYAAWQQEQLSGSALQTHKDYWLRQLAGQLPVLEFPGDRVRPSAKTYNGGVLNKRLNAGLTSGIKAFSREQGGTLFMGLLSAIYVLLYKYTGQEDILIGSPISGREHIDLENQLGVYINTLPLRARFRGDDNFTALFTRIKQITLEAYEHQAYPFDELVKELDLQWDRSRSAVFDVMVSLQNTGSSRVEGPQDIGGLSVSTYNAGEITFSRFDLTFNFAEIEKELRVNVEYNSDIYDRGSVERLVNHLGQLLKAALEQPLTPLRRLDFLTAAEKYQLITTFNETAVAWPKDNTVIDLFRQQVQKTPDSIALAFEEVAMTYRELNEVSNQLGDYIRQTYKIRADEPVGIRLGRGEWLIIAILGVLKSGGAYVPIDPEYPEERIRYMVADSDCRLVIDEGELEKFRRTQEKYDRNDRKLIKFPDDLLYIMYTSGSTGQPKGVMITHAGVIRLVRPANYVSLTGETVLLSTGAICFDATSFEYWGMLLNGGRLVMCRQEVLMDGEKLEEEIKKKGVNMMWFTAGWLNQLVDTNIGIFRGLKTILAGGDKLSPGHMGALRRQYPTLNMINGYGPTENTTFSLAFRIGAFPDAENIPIGRPVSNSTAYILDEEGQVLPLGVVGEVCVGGAGLARGYWKNEELTAARFVPHPFLPGERIYRTGDLGRWLADGDIAFMGRKDEQVKVRGYRIESGEIERVLESHPAVAAAVVVARAWPGRPGIAGSPEPAGSAGTAGGARELVAYIVGRRDGDRRPAVSELQAYLRDRLPVYMLPGYYVELDELPLTANGKVDRARLPEPEAGSVLSSGMAYIGPRNSTEETLQGIWEEILGREKIGMKDNFFELGGHSLKATLLSSRIHKEFAVRAGLRDLFANPILEQQAQLIRQARKTAFISIPSIGLQPHYPLSSSQRLFWISCQFEEGNVAYNMPGAYVFEGDLDLAALEHSFHSLIERHESLRTIFRDDGHGEVRQFICSAGDKRFGINYSDLRAEMEGTVKSLVHISFTEPFNLSSGPLMRARLFRIADDKWIFTYVMHHIIGDGWSMVILIRELLLLYNAYSRNEPDPLTPLRIQYKDYAAWQQAQLKGKELRAHKAYWLSRFRGELPLFDLPCAKVRPAMKTYNGGIVRKKINNDIFLALQAITREQDSSLFMGLLAAVNALLFRYTRQTDIIIGTSIAGREHTDLENQIGYYLNTLALRTRFSGEDSYKELLAGVRHTTLDAYEYQAYPFEDLVDALNCQRDISRNNLFDVFVVMRNTDFKNTGEPEQGLLDIKVSHFGSTEHQTSKFDLTFGFSETEGELQGDIEYNSDLLDRVIVQRMADNLERLLADITKYPDRPIRQLDLKFPEDARHQGFSDAEMESRFSSPITDEFE